MTDLDDIIPILSEFVETHSRNDKKLILKEKTLSDDMATINVVSEFSWQIVGIWQIGEKHFRIDVYDQELSNAVYNDIAKKLEAKGFGIRYVHRYTKDPLLVYDTKNKS